eukprot:SAG31_NODE_1689_length_7525_cov_3.264745_10_plen_39_part_00
MPNHRHSEFELAGVWQQREGLTKFVGSYLKVSGFENIP